MDSFANEVKTPAVKLTVQDNAPVQTVELFQTPVTPLTEDEPVMNTGLRCVSLETLKRIAEEQAGYISSINNDDITGIEYKALVSRNSQDSDRIASEILQIMTKPSGQTKGITKWLGDLACHHLKLAEEHPLRLMGEIKAEVDTFMMLMSNRLNQQTQQHARKTVVASAALEKIGRVVVNVPALTESKNLVKESDTLKPAIEEPESISDEPVICDKGTGEATVHTVEELENLCDTLVTMLVSRILQDSAICVFTDSFTSATMTLKEMLLTEIAGSDIAIKTSSRHCKRVVKAVYKDLIEKTDRPEMILLYLVERKPSLYKNIIESLKMQLFTPQKKNGIIRFLRSVSRIMAKPFTACFRRGCND